MLKQPHWSEWTCIAGEWALLVSTMMLEGRGQVSVLSYGKCGGNGNRLSIQ